MKLSEICSYRSERVKSNTLSVENYISTENMLPNKSGVSSASKVPPEAAVLYKKGDILISNIRPYFKKIWQAQFSGGCSSDVLCIRANSRVNQDYLYYLLSQDSFFDYVMSGAKGSKMPRGDKKQIMDWDVELPKMEEQIRIASLLRSIDDKIELNNRINHNLEEQAQALYKSWFVDFEPFKDGKFVESELGMIPEGWSVNRLSDYAHLIKDSINPTKHPDTVFAHYSIPAFDNEQNPEIQQGNEIMSNKFIVPKKCVMFSKLNPKIKRVWIICQCLGNAISSTEFAIYQARHNNYFGFVCSYINSDFYYGKVMTLVNGATGSHQRFHTEDTLNFTFAANTEAIERFSRTIEPLYLQMDLLREENRKLTAKRDTILPRLMSGEINC